MAVTLTVAELVAALRLTNTAEETTEVTRLLSYASQAVIRHVPDAPDAVHNEAARRLCGYLYDQPESSRDSAYSNALRNSGAARMLLPYRVHRAGIADGEAVSEAQRAVGTVGNPVVDVMVNGAELLVTFADGTEETHPLPDTGEDATARAKADANTASQTAHATNPNAHHVPPTSGVVVVAESVRLPAPAVAMRIGWNQTQTPSEAIFTRANNHPTDGAAVGDSDGASTPPFPPALNTDTTLYLHLWLEDGADVADISEISTGPITYLSFFDAPVDLTVAGVDGRLYVMTVRFPPLPGTVFSALLGGDLIASQPWVGEQIAAIPASPGGGGPTFALLATLTPDGTRINYSATTAEANAIIAGWNAGTYYGFQVDVEWTLTIQNAPWNFRSRDVFYRRPDVLTDGEYHLYCGTFDDNSLSTPFGMRLEIDRRPAQDATMVHFGTSLNAAATVKIWGLS